MRKYAFLYAWASLLAALALLYVREVPAEANPLPQAPPTPQPTLVLPSTHPILLTGSVPDPKQVGVHWFEATGHTLRGSFLDYWNKYGGLAQFGYPLTEEFYEPVGADGTQYLVQYFERNRFEYHPENADSTYEVLLGALGRDFHAQDPPASPLPAPAHYFRETGHNLSGLFKGYWETHGGLFVHGYPITEEYEEKNPQDGKTYKVQYFERSKFEYHPENARSPHEVLLGLLGRQLSERKGYPYGWYPHYGRSTDFSWVAGLWIAPYLSCFQCQCDVVKYVQDSRYFGIGINVKPTGSGWRTAMGTTIVGRTMPVVIFGYRANDEPQVASAPCDAPEYIVSKVQPNPEK
ncbi:MAG TPA: hypothetical protein VGE45_08885 [Chloroflexia bacterium]